ncbi:MAG: type I-E CRISPR-associated protein Cas7/Cse4/CasC [Puniceicoccales bacterium]|jgi:CRISPR system Cascade subunit CasC|nr:type I-E CRISPR-associated protein Cas7/Cse4/CasC [Puniceicoccales bacterium]
MKLLEIHTLKSLPVSCVNRDDANQAKTAIFGGVRRARISSQCYKRAIRQKAIALDPENFYGCRLDLGRQNDADLAKNLQLYCQENGFPKSLWEGIDAEIVAKFRKDFFKKPKKDTDGKNSSDAMIFISPMEIMACSQGNWKTAVGADIALFGRMVAGNPAFNVEAAASFSHALSTHRVDPDADFFTCVDDLVAASEDGAGAGHLNLQSFQSATYYYYIAINLDMLFDEKHLNYMKEEKRGEFLKKFLEAVIESQPSAKQHSMNCETRPTVLAIVREGAPMQLCNAFERPIQAPREGGYLAPSLRMLLQEWKFAKKQWGLDGTNGWTLCEISEYCKICEEASARPVGLGNFLEQVSKCCLDLVTNGIASKLNGGFANG